MYTEEVAKNIFRIPVALPDNPLRELNSYLIKDKERSLLIDTGFYMDVCRDALLGGLCELGEDPRSVDIFLTHMHSDHAGLAADIAGEGMRIMIGETDRKLLDTTASEDRHIVNRIARRYRSAGMPAHIIENMRTINPAIAYSNPADGISYTGMNNMDTVCAGGYVLRCIDTPGHTPGHMCLWDSGNELMFTGDHVLFDITPNITAWASVRDSLGDYLDSLSAIARYPVKTALPGHRKPGDFHARIDHLLLHHQTRLSEVESLAADAPGSTAYEIAGKMKWKIRAKSWDEFPAPQKIFAVGECMSHLDYLLLRNRLISEKDGEVSRYFIDNRQ